MKLKGIIEMDSLSKEKLAHYKNKKGLTHNKIKELTGIPISTIDKLFAGLTKNPTLDTLKAITRVLECSIDDVMDYEYDPIEGFYADRQTSKIAQSIQGSQELKDLLNILIELSKEDLKLITDVSKRFPHQKNTI
jgi:DNA-binding Xre family transcriptional regulator